MATIPVFDIRKNKVSDLELADEIFNTDVKGHLIHDMVRYQLAARRQGTACVKGRSEISGGGKKPYRQKGTGNARQGTITAPNFVGGGVVFGPKPRDYSFKLNRKVKRAALRSALSTRFKESRLTVLDKFELDKISTKSVAAVINLFDLSGTLLVIDGPNENLELSARNLKSVKVLRAEGVNVYDVMNYPNLVITQGAVSQLEGALEK